MSRILALLPLLAACGGDIVDRGSVEVCADGVDGGDDAVLSLDGSISAIGGGACSDSTLSFTVTGDQEVTIGLTVTDADNADITPDPGLVVDQAVSLHYRYKLVWGDVAGFALTDADGLDLAAEEGFWGGALQDGDIDGLTVARGKDEVARERDTCGHVVGYEVVFTGDDVVAVQPVDSADIQVGGTTLTATAVGAYDYEDGPNCSVEDRTGGTAWVVSR